MSEMPTLDHLFHAVMEQREEILRAFVAKYGMQPEEVVQVHQDGRWFVMKREDILNRPRWLPPPERIVVRSGKWHFIADKSVVHDISDMPVYVTRDPVVPAP